MNKYTELKSKHQAEFNAFPIGAAFNQKQFDEMMMNWGFKPTDIRLIIDVGFGSYVRRSDLAAFNEMVERHHTERQMAMEKNEDDYLFHMFNYELANHEYGYTQDLTDTLDALGLTIDEINANPIMADALKRAIAAQEEF